MSWYYYPTPYDPEPYDEEEHPATCICPECVYDEWLIYGLCPAHEQGEDRQDPLDDENWEPPF